MPEDKRRTYFTRYYCLECGEACKVQKNIGATIYWCPKCGPRISTTLSLEEVVVEDMPKGMYDKLSKHLDELKEKEGK